MTPEASPQSHPMGMALAQGESHPSPKASTVHSSEPPYEYKYVVTAEQAAKIAEWASAHLAPDPHADPGAGGVYRVTSLYLDNDQLDVYHRRGSYGRAKYRLRRYNEVENLFLERKCKVKGKVRKRRSLVGPEELAWLSSPKRPEGWAGRWFARRIELRGLVPTALVSYQRVARVSEGTHGPIRLTIDRDFFCRPADAFQIPRLSDGPPLFDGVGILELKFRVAMPAQFKSLLVEHELIRAKASKYRTAIEACGLSQARGTNA